MKLGITGTHLGMFAEQRNRFAMSLGLLHPQQFHHGDCVGVDEEAAKTVELLIPTCRIFVHPPTNSSKRAFWKGSGLEVVLPAKPYLVRNQDIVDAADQLIACPSEYDEVLRSGTWATVRYARKQGKPVWIIYPDGRLIKETRT